VSVGPSALPAHATIPKGEVGGPSEPSPPWELVFLDGFDGPVGEVPAQWHTMPGWNGAAQNGLGQLEVGQLAQLRSTAGWTLPPGTRVRVSGSMLMPDTGSNYAALWIQHPSPLDPREIDVIESYGPMKATGAQLGSYLCYDETIDNGIDECGTAGLAPELWPVDHAFPAGVKPWESYWEYHAEFTVGGDQVLFKAEDAFGAQPYAVTSLPDARRVPGNSLPFHLRLSNKDVGPEYVVPGGARLPMLVDWVKVEVQYPLGLG
jgi:hypothetical protein